MRLLESQSRVAEQAPFVILDRLKEIYAREPGVIFKDDFLRYMDETNLTYFAGLAIQMLGETYDEPYQIMIGKKPAVNNDSRFEAAVLVSRPGTEQPSILPGNSVLATPGLINIRSSQNGEPFFGITLPVEAFLRFDHSRKTVVSYRDSASKKGFMRTVELMAYGHSDDEFVNVGPAAAANTVRIALGVLIEAVETTLGERLTPPTLNRRVVDYLGRLAGRTTSDAN